MVLTILLILASLDTLGPRVTVETTFMIPQKKSLKINSPVFRRINMKFYFLQRGHTKGYTRSCKKISILSHFNHCTLGTTSYFKISIFANSLFLMVDTSAYTDWCGFSSCSLSQISRYLQRVSLTFPLTISQKLPHQNISNIQQGFFY